MNDQPEPAPAQATSGLELAGGTGVWIRTEDPSGQVRPARRPPRLLAPVAIGHDRPPQQQTSGADR